METLPCGCHVGTTEANGKQVFLYEPCSLDCKYYHYVLAETERQGKETRVIDLR